MRLRHLAGAAAGAFAVGVSVGVGELRPLIGRRVTGTRKSLKSRTLPEAPRGLSSAPADAEAAPKPRAWRRTLRSILVYGLGGGLLVAALRLTEYRFLVVEHSLEIYGGLVAATFAGLGTRRAGAGGEAARPLRLSPKQLHALVVARGQPGRCFTRGAGFRGRAGTRCRAATPWSP